MNHVELHVHDYYSLLDGHSSPAEYMARAKELGMTHMAETNHGTLMGHREFQREAKKAGIKPILGCEMYITDDIYDRRTKANRQDGTSIYNHLTVLAKNDVGLKNLQKMSEIAWTEGFYHKPRISIDILGEHSEGIIALSGCMSGMVAKSYLEGNLDMSKAYAKRFWEVLGDDFYIEVMESNDEKLNRYLMDLAHSNGLKPVITSDCHMARKRHLPVADAMLIQSTGVKPKSGLDMSKTQQMNLMETLNYLYPDRKMTFKDFELWLHSYDEHVANLEKHGIDKEPVDNTMLVASKIGDYEYVEKQETLPKFDGVEDSVKALRDEVYLGLKNRGKDDDPEYISRVEDELSVITDLKLSDYFLIEKDFVDYAKANDILTGFGRGSAVSYLVNYALGITKIDPMPYDLLPERFLSRDRSDGADIDTDLAIEGRYKVKKYIDSKYENSSNIATIGYYGGKSAIKAAARIVNAPYGVTNKLMGLIAGLEDFEVNPIASDYRAKYPHVLPLAKSLDGRIEKIGMHAGGTILSKQPISNNVPIQTAKDPSDPAAGRVQLSGYDMREMADMGYIKYDLLGLRTLSIVDDTLRLIKERHGIDINIEEMDIEDPNIYGMLSEGYTQGCFQAEATASTKTILDMDGVADFRELMASNALVRPGAANSSVGRDYKEGKRTGRIKKMHPDFDYYLRDTYGAVLYQEQQLLLCEHIAGMSKRDANKVRKAISKKILADLEVWKDEFISGATEKVGAEKAESIWKDLEASADYAFAKAHALAYSMLTYLTAWLKYYYPMEFFVSAINRMGGDKSDRVRVIKYMLELKRMGFTIMLPHVNASSAQAEIRNDENGEHIRLGLTQIKFVKDRSAGPVLRNAPYESYADMLKRAKPNGSVLKALNAVGAASFEDNPLTGNEKSNFFTYLALPIMDTSDVPPVVAAQFRDMVDYSEDGTFVCMAIVANDKRGPNWRLVDIVDETGVASAFVPAQSDIEVGSIYIMLVSDNSVIDWISTSELGDGSDFAKFLQTPSLTDLDDDALRVVGFRSRKTRNGDKMGTVVLADHNKEMLGAVVWPSDYLTASVILTVGADVKVGLKELDNGGYCVSGMKKAGK